MIENTELLDQIIVGYVPHRIYAFSTPQSVDYLKIGETSRGVPVRLKEWQSKIADLKHEKDWLAMLPKDTVKQKEFFRDFALHKYFKDNAFDFLLPEDAPGNSKEFYKVTLEQVEDGIEAIDQDYTSEPPHQYTYLSIEDNSKKVEKWAITENFKPRGNQKEVIDNIVAVSKDKKVAPNYLLFAVMRFGKTFVALEAAKELDSKLTVVVSAKADVKLEWKQNLESHEDFDGYLFLDSKSLRDSSTAIEDNLKENKVVLFLTLQDLSGSDIKEKHKQVFEQHIDLLIIDESHFGARAQSYGEVIYSSSSERKKFFNNQQQYASDDNNEINALDNLKALSPDCTLHLSGTPYRILMGNEFSNPKQIVGKVQFEDILDAKAKWYEEHLFEPEWKNPYFGFPQMVRFAFNLNDDAKQKVEDLTKDGKKSQLNELFGPMANNKDNDNHVKFKHESYVLNTLQALDGSVESESIFPILNYDKLKEGKMAHHIVMVLPFKASCDAMERLLTDHKDVFINFNDYEIINIAGHDAPSRQNAKKKIADYANEGKKTISLTVNKMLTGVTVPQWDTMIFLKDTQSPQEYDQAIYRLQSPYVTKLVDEDGKILNREDLKPQTLLIDFAPNRMMSIEQYKAFILTASEANVGNNKVKESLIRQMTASPIITFNSKKLTQVQPADILKYIAAYSSEKGIIEEAGEISVDLSILENAIIKAAIESENEIGSKAGIKFGQNEDGDDETDAGDVDSEPGDDDDDEGSDGDGSTESAESKDEKDSLAKKIQNYYLRILFYAFLSEETEINNLVDVIDSFDHNKRLAEHLGIEKSVLQEIDKTLTNPRVRIELDNKISNANALLVDDSLEPSEKVARAIKSFKRISESEIFTHRKITELMVEQVLAEIDFTDFNNNPKLFIDIVSKSGIYLVVLFDKLLAKGVDSEVAKNCLYAVATSPVAYEFTRKVYELMGLPVDHIVDIEWASSYDLIREKEATYVINGLNQYYFKGDDNMKFDVVVGNPPYQDEHVGNNNQAPPIFNLFYDLAEKMAPKYCLISPARFLANQGATPKAWNNKMLNDDHLKIEYFNARSKEVFPSIDIKGGVVVIYRDKDKEFGAIEIFIPFEELSGIYQKVKKITKDNISGFVYSPDSYRLTDTMFEENPDLVGRADDSHAKAVASSVFERYPEVFSDTKPSDDDDYIQIYGRQNGERTYKFIKRKYVAQHNNLDKWKVFVPGANGTGVIGEVVSTPVIGQPVVGHNQTFVSLGEFETEFEAESLLKYIKSKFGRIMLGIMKTTHNNQSKNTWSKVPMQDFTPDSDIDWTKSIPEIDQQLYTKYGLSQEEIDFIEEKVKAMD